MFMGHRSRISGYDTTVLDVDWRTSISVIRRFDTRIVGSSEIIPTTFLGSLGDIDTSWFTGRCVGVQDEKSCRGNPKCGLVSPERHAL
ncbi:hypothetical protein WG66_016268 [Moniliophthora roreri]|nr:hypothetical protein WG66_016268 [Moniliophthora roreri]